MSQSTSRKVDTNKDKKRRSSPHSKHSPKSSKHYGLVAKSFVKKNLNIQLFECCDRRARLKDKLAERCSSKQEARKRIKAFKAHMAEKAKEKQDRSKAKKDLQEESESDKESDSEDEFDSQQTLIKDIIFTENKIKSLEKSDELND